MASRKAESDDSNQKSTLSDVQPEVVLRSPSKSQSNGNSRVDIEDAKTNEPVKSSPSVSRIQTWYNLIPLLFAIRKHPLSPNARLPMLKLPAQFLFTHLGRFLFKNNHLNKLWGINLIILSRNRHQTPFRQMKINLPNYQFHLISEGQRHASPRFSNLRSVNPTLRQ